jgi:hypothetical protein
VATLLERRLPYPTILEVGERDPALIARVLNSAVSGNLNVVGQVEVLAGTTETTVHDPRISAQSLFAWQALSASGAALIPSIWLKTRGVRECVVGHDAPAADVWLEYGVFG